jgi:2-iminoacetate synthase ThiH
LESERASVDALGALADFANQRRNGRKSTYLLNRYINYSNYCILSCQFCAFARKKRDADGFQLTVEEMVTTRPARCLRMRGNTARVTFIGPNSSVSIWWRT